jgi:surface protein
MSSWSNVVNGFGGTNTTVLFDLTPVTTLDLSHIVEIADRDMFSSAFNNFSATMTSVDLSSLKTISDYQSCYYMLSNNVNLANVNISSLRTISGPYACNYMFYGCTAITSIDLSSLETVSFYGSCRYMFQNCTGLSSVNLSSLTNITNAYGCADMFSGCTGLTDIKFPSLKTVYDNQVFSNMLANVTGCTVHFPSNMSSYDFNVGGTNTTVLYDLPATVTLTGADTKTYERNPKYDTATALGWYEVGTDRFTTQVYTSGTTDPAVGDTIYSDSACTNAVTTIDSIA